MFLWKICVSGCFVCLWLWALDCLLAPDDSDVPRWPPWPTHSAFDGGDDDIDGDDDGGGHGSHGNHGSDVL